MMVVSGSRISLHLRECDLRLGLGLGLGFYGTRFVSFSSMKPHHHNHSRHGSHSRISSSSSSNIPSQSHRNLPILSDCFSQQEDAHECESPPGELSSVAGGIVALGKFDALHIGHRELAIQASKVGAPYLLSFVGMAEVLGWEPRIPIVAKCDRQRVLSTWAPYCGDVVPAEFEIEFSSVRHLSPRQFVEKLSKELRVCGVVAGENYRFGYKAAGDASELARLCGEYGIQSYIINSVMDKNQQFIDFDARNLEERGQVSSTRVRHALAQGDMKYVSDLLGRHHRLIAKVSDQEGFKGSKHLLSAPKSCLLNLAPRNGIYDNCYLILGRESSIPCRIVLDATHIHVEMDEGDTCNYIGFQDFKVLQIEFGDSRL